MNEQHQEGKRPFALVVPQFPGNRGEVDRIHVRQSDDVQSSKLIVHHYLEVGFLELGYPHFVEYRSSSTSGRYVRTSPFDLGVVPNCCLDSLRGRALDRVRVAERTYFLHSEKEKRIENNVRKEDT